MRAQTKTIEPKKRFHKQRRFWFIVSGQKSTAFLWKTSGHQCGYENCQKKWSSIRVVVHEHYRLRRGKKANNYKKKESEL